MSAPKDLTGQRFGKLVAIRPTEERRHKNVVWECQCDCGKTAFVVGTSLRIGATKSCGCNREAGIQSGDRFGRLTAIRPTEMRKGKKIVWECACDCGNIKYVSTKHLKDGTTLSCGCLQREIHTTHGGSKDKLYKLWAKMNQRCNNAQDLRYCYYGGRGIRVCDEWANDYAAFRAWALSNGYAEGKQIHRIDNDGNYEPRNCVWMTASEHMKLHNELRRQQKTE